MSEDDTTDLDSDDSDESDLRERMMRDKRSPFANWCPPKRRREKDLHQPSEAEVKAAKKRLRLFRCVPLEATLARSACAKRFKRATADPFGTYAPCHKCPTGKRHAKKIK